MPKVLKKILYQIPPIQNNTQPFLQIPIGLSLSPHQLWMTLTIQENWEEGKFVDVDLIDHHNTTEESDRIHHKHSAHFEKVTEQYSPCHSTTSCLEYQIPEPEYYNSNTQPKQYQRYQNPNIHLPPPPSTEDLCTWYGHGCGRAKHLELHSHRLYVEKTRSKEIF